MKTTRIWILTPSPHLKGVAGGVENYHRLRLSPPPLPTHINAHALIHTFHTFYLPLPLPPPFMTLITVSVVSQHEFVAPY